MVMMNMIESVTTKIRRRIGAPTKINLLGRCKILNRNKQSSPSSGLSPLQLNLDSSAIIQATTARVMGIQCPKKFIKILEVHLIIIIKAIRTMAVLRDWNSRGWCAANRS